MDLDLGRVLALRGRQRDAAGHQHARQIVRRGQRHHHRGRPLSQVATPSTAPRVGRLRMRRRNTVDGVVAIGQGRTSRWCPASARRRGRCRPRRRARHRATQLASGGFDQQSDFPMAAVEAERDGRAVGRAQAAVRREDETSVPPSFAGSQPMPAFMVQPKRLPLGAVRNISGVNGRLPAGPCAFVRASNREAWPESNTDFESGIRVLQTIGLTQ
jgi:hypothetical protein